MVFIAIGSNIDPEQNILEALVRLKAAVSPVSCSRFYRSAALRRPQDPVFLNGMVAVKTDMPPRVLKYDVLRGIEQDLGRQHSADTYAPRTIDLDIAVYGSLVVNEPDLQIPDTDILDRPFLAVPLNELAPELVLPGIGRALSEIVATMDTSSISLDAEFSQKAKETFLK